MVAQAAVSDGEVLDHRPPLEDGCAAADVDIGGGQVAKAFVVATVVVVLDEAPDGDLESRRDPSWKTSGGFHGGGDRASGRLFR
jgi:hypothetical protein